MDATTGAPPRPPGDCLLLVNPHWRPAREDVPPPFDAVVGSWPVEDGKVGRFRVNPGHRPPDEDAPSDPLDAVLRLVQRGGATTAHLQLLLWDTEFDVAVDGSGRPLVTTSPDDVPCVLLVTGEAHRARFPRSDWSRVDLVGLVTLLADGTDVLINPDGAAAVRLTGDFIRDTVLLGEEVGTAFTVDDLVTDGLGVTRWDGAAGPGGGTAE
ncbi:type VII secretion system-associated protein [Saccharothrix australiensis]|uniref:Type III secretion system (T3SS) SseB-like protein n=1 Tax=Saccharothrix australiensis TaxID=2072 RepID=A0A495W5N6_9PSEU|nr:type VII secretion system-associated protein [Saccharothrix australiensis]RKT56749.1 hypothetical protein C8E97_5459 [Saccharothrix australiensis]